MSVFLTSLYCWRLHWMWMQLYVFNVGYAFDRTAQTDGFWEQSFKIRQNLMYLGWNKLPSQPLLLTVLGGIGESYLSVSQFLTSFYFLGQLVGLLLICCSHLSSKCLDLPRTTGRKWHLWKQSVCLEGQCFLGLGGNPWGGNPCGGDCARGEWHSPMDSYWGQVYPWKDWHSSVSSDTKGAE